jgi:hypothetical protein
MWGSTSTRMKICQRIERILTDSFFNPFHPLNPLTFSKDGHCPSAWADRGECRRCGDSGVWDCGVMYPLERSN